MVHILYAFTVFFLVGLESSSMCTLGSRRVDCTLGGHHEALGFER